MDFNGNHKWRIKIKILKELFSINKVVTLLKFKSAVNLLLLIGGAIERARPNEIFAIEIALSIAPPIRNIANSLKPYNFVNTKQLFQFVLIFILHLWFPLKSTFYLEITRCTCTIFGTVFSYLKILHNKHEIIFLQNKFLQKNSYL